MYITTKHPRSRHGMPVIISDAGQVMNYPRGIETVLERLHMHPDGAAKLAGINRRTLDNYRKGRIRPTAAFLNVLADALDAGTDQPQNQ